MHLISCNWLPFYRPCSFASQTFIWFANFHIIALILMQKNWFYYTIVLYCTQEKHYRFNARILKKRTADTYTRTVLLLSKSTKHWHYCFLLICIQIVPYLELERYFHKEIARVQARWYGQQSGKGVKHPVTSKHIRKLYKRKQDSVTDYLHKITRYLAEYCREQGIPP